MRQFHINLNTETEVIYIDTIGRNGNNTQQQISHTPESYQHPCDLETAQGNIMTKVLYCRIGYNNHVSF